MLIVIGAIIILKVGFGALYLMFRNNHICKFRINVVNKYGVKKLESLPDYDTMLYRKFWVWPMGKFLEA